VSPCFTFPHGRAFFCIVPSLCVFFGKAHKKPAYG